VFGDGDKVHIAYWRSVKFVDHKGKKKAEREFFTIASGSRTN
jgi:hypothetical protein